MKKYLPYIIGAVIVLGGAGAYIATKDKGGDKSNSQAATENKNSSGETAALKYKDACKLFTREQIGSALGGTFGEGEEGIANSTATPGTPDYDNEELRGSTCDFKQDNDGTTAGMTQAFTLSVAINNYATVDKASAFMKDLHNPPTAEGQEAMNKPVDVDGVGDQAFFAKVNTGTTGTSDKVETLYIRTGRQVIVLTATKLAGVDHEAVQASLTDLAKKL